jgi:MinD-like ATPase involved in chromosome partitioning or flagellar assembly
VTEPEIALVFTAEPWVEELHRHLSDHGGARVRSLVVEESVALEETYDVLVVSHRWPALTQAFVGDLHERGRRVLGVHDVAEPASRAHLAAVDVDAVIEADAGPDAFVRALATLGSQPGRRRPVGVLPAAARAARLVAVGGAPGVGRTEIALELACSTARTSACTFVDCDDVAPSVAQRLGLAIEPNLRTAIDAVEHGRGDLATAVLEVSGTGLGVVGGISSPVGWTQVRPGEVVRVIDRLAESVGTVIVDGVGSLEDLGGPPRGRFATAQALAREADVLVAVCDASPVGVTRLLSWTVAARRFAPETPIVVVVNRAPASAFRRGELYDEITSSVHVVDVGFVPTDSHVTVAAWAGQPVARGRFTRALARTSEVVRELPRRVIGVGVDADVDVAS